MGTEASGLLLADLDADQIEAATSFGGPVVVIAGPGSGKTTAITRRIAYGALTEQLSPRHTLAVTYTTKAAAELRSRLFELGVNGVQARTIHSAALRQIKHFWPQAFGAELPQVIDARMSLLTEALAGTGTSAGPGLLRDVLAEIHWAKVSNVPAGDYPRLAEGAGRVVEGADPIRVASLFAAYERAKTSHGLIDVDDILLCDAALLHGFPEIAAEVRRTYRHVLVDEYQDVSPIQHTLLDLWVGERDDLCVVGDPNQSIHGYAGARPGYLLRFHRDHPGARVITLERNYRSTPPIVAAGNAVLDPHAGGVRSRAVRTGGHGVWFKEARDPAAEAAQAADWFDQLHQRGVGWADMAALFRTAAQSAPLEAELTRRAIPNRLISPESSQADDQPAGVVLTSMHAAKGLEWSAVAAMGCHEGSIPHALATTDPELAEERRLLHVALTRARDWLWVSWSRGGRVAGGPAMSRFLREVITEDDPQPLLAPLPTGPLLCRVCGRPVSRPGELRLRRHLTCQAPVDPDVVERLREWRSARAREAGVAAFLVLTDNAVQALAELCPDTVEQARQVVGAASRITRDDAAQLVALVTRQTSSS